jgi:hypothetical protein
MKARLKHQQSNLFKEHLPKVSPEVLTPFAANRYDFSNWAVPESFKKAVAKETEQELQILRDRYRALGRNLSGKDTFEIKVRVKSKHNTILLENRLRFALLEESEKILRLLRTRGLGPVLHSTILSENRLQFITKLNLNQFPEADHRSPLYLGPGQVMEQKEPFFGEATEHNRCAPLCPNGYFNVIHPDLVRDYGYAFHAHVSRVPNVEHPAKQRLVGINTDFFAAYLSGDKRFGHDLMFYVPESTFYFYDPLVDHYLPTTEDKFDYSSH